MTQISKERMREMYGKIAMLAGSNVDVTVPHAGIRKYDLPLGDVSIGEALIGLGVAKDEEEAKALVSSVLKSAIAIVAIGADEPLNATFDLMKFGFFLGLQAGKVKVEKEAV